MREISFTVMCCVEPQGSKKSFVVPGKNGARPRAVIVDDNKASLRSYRSQVTREAVHALAQANLPRPLADKHVPVELTLEFMFLRPASAKKRQYPSVLPDIDKCLRSTFDAMTGVIFLDDAQVVKVTATKVYGDIECVRVTAGIIRGGIGKENPSLLGSQDCSEGKI